MIQTAPEKPDSSKIYSLIAPRKESFPLDSLSQWQLSRLRHHADFQVVYAHARKQHSSSIAWFAYVRSESGTCNAPARVGLTVGKVLGKAHDRNRIKRRLRAAIRAHVELLPPGLDLILHPRRSVLSMEYLDLLAEVQGIFSRAAECVQRNPSALMKKLSTPAVASQDGDRRGVSPASASSRLARVERAGVGISGVERSGAGR